MNLTIFAGILLAVTLVTARRASLVRIRDLFFLISTQYLIDFHQLAQNHFVLRVRKLYELPAKLMNLTKLSEKLLDQQIWYTIRRLIPSDRH